MTLEEALQEIERLRWVLSKRVDAETNPKGPQTLLDTYDQMNPAWIDAMRFGAGYHMPPTWREVEVTPLLNDGEDSAYSKGKRDE